MTFALVGVATKIQAIFYLIKSAHQQAGYNNRNVGNVTTFNVTGLIEGTTYYYRVRAVNAGGTSASSNTISATTLINPPAAPVAITADPIAQTSFTAKWNSSSTATGYKLDVSAVNTFTTLLAGYNDLDVANVTSYAISGLTANTSYYYRIRAYNGGGTSSNSNAITVNTLPDPPSAPAATAATDLAQTSLSANWTSAVSATGYRLDVSTSNTFSTFVTGYNNKDVGNVISYSVTGLTANTLYYYRVRAYNTGGESPNSNVISPTTLPDPPALLAATIAAI